MAEAFAPCGELPSIYELETGVRPCAYGGLYDYILGWADFTVKNGE